MAHPSTLFRFQLALSDVDRGVYETLDLRVPMHPSENEAFLLTRVLAYALNFEDGLEFSAGGLSDPEAPALRIDATVGKMRLWIDIGNPAPKRLHKAAKAAERVRVYTYKDPENIRREAEGEHIHRAEAIEIFAFDAKFLDGLARRLERDNRWTILHHDGELTVTVGDDPASTPVVRYSLG